jgi:hypothetical protein
MANKGCWNHVLDGLEEQLNQLDKLGLLFFNRSPNIGRLEIDRTARPELIFLLASYNPASEKLNPFFDEIETHDEFDLLFFVSCFAGYGMHHASMLTLDEFKAEVSRLFRLAKRKVG